MQNQLNTQYMPLQSQTAPVQPQYCGAPSSSVGAVNIQIYSPSVNQPGFYQPAPCAPYPCNYNTPINYTNMPAQNFNYNNQGATNPQTAPQAAPQTAPQTPSQTPAAPQEQQKTAENTQAQTAENVTDLSDEYIKKLEASLNSPDKNTRIAGAKELYDRFSEDPSRKEHPALTPLLNKALQDPLSTVKFFALTALNLDHAKGNDETVEILKGLQSSNTCYGEDASLASQILNKMNSNATAQTQTNTQNSQNVNNVKAENPPIA